MSSAAKKLTDGSKSNSEGEGVEACELVRILFTDNAGQRRMKAVPKRRFENVVRNSGVGLCQAISGLGSGSDALAPGSGVSACFEVKLVPDLSTLKTIPWCPSHQIVIASQMLSAETSWSLCARETLKRLSNTLREEFKMVLHAGFESEFYLLNKDLSPVDQTLYCSAFAFDCSSAVLSECVRNIESMGIEVETIHAESGGGQFELSVAHSHALSCADNVSLVRYAVQGTASKHGLIATFLPKVFASGAGNGSHVHLSLWNEDETENLFPYKGPNKKTGSVLESSEESEVETLAQAHKDFGIGISNTAEAFMAGILFHLPSLMALTCSVPNSFLRFVPYYWAGAFQCWGLENREAALRANCFYSDSEPVAEQGTAEADKTKFVHASKVTNFELKTSDATGNPYLALSGILAAGIDGLRKGMTLPEPVYTNPVEIPEEKRTFAKLPVTLEEAAERFSENHVLKEALGEKMSQCVAALRRSDVAHYKNISFDESVKTLVQKY